MSARDDVLAGIRRSLGVTGTERPRVAAVAARLTDPPRGVIPARGQGDAAARIATFKAEALRSMFALGVHNLAPTFEGMTWSLEICRKPRFAR